MHNVDRGLQPFLKEELQGDGKDDDALIDALAKRIVRMGLAVPAIFFLESSKPLNFLGSQLLVFLEPFVKTFFDVKSYERFYLLMEERENVEKLIRRVEEREEDLREEKREEKRERKRERKKEKEKKKHERSNS